MKYIYIFLLVFSFTLFAKEKVNSQLSHIPLTEAQINKSQEITADYKKIDEAIEVFVFLHYATFTVQNWKVIQMKESSDGKFNAIIPGDAFLKGGVVYYIEVVDEFEDIVGKFKSKDDPQYVSIIQKQEKNKKNIKEKSSIKKQENKNEKNSSDKSNLTDTLFEEELSLFNQDELEVVTASKKAQKSVEAPAIITVISSKMIEQLGASNLIDVLKYVPSISTKIKSDGKYVISIRGVEKDGNILLLLNGSRINNLYDSSTIYDIPTSLIKRIEVIRGPGSALFGTDAVAGIINIITKDKSNDIFYSMGLNNDLNLSFNSSFDFTDKLKLTVLGGLSNDNGAKAKLLGDLYHNRNWSLTHDPDNPFYAQRNFDLAYLQTSLSYGNFKASAFTMRENHSDWVGPRFVATEDSSYTNWRAKLNISYNLSFSNIDISSRLYGDFLQSNNYIQTTPRKYVQKTSGIEFTEGALTKEKYNIISFGADIQANINLGDFDITTGFDSTYFKVVDFSLGRNYSLLSDDYYRENFLYNDNLNQLGKDRAVLALFLQGEYKYKDLGLILGVRGDYYTDMKLGAINPRAGLVYGIDYIRFKLLYGEAFRVPTFKELYDNSNLSVHGIRGNEALDPEKVRTMEAALETNLWKFKLKGNFFYNLSYNIISPFDRNGSGGVGLYDNIGSTKSFGFETELIGDFKYFSFFANLSWFRNSFEWSELIWKEGLKPELTTRESLITHIPMRRINLGVTARYKKASLFMGFIRTSKTLNNNRMPLEKLRIIEIPASWSIDMNMSYMLYKDLQLSFIFRNIGYKKYVAPDSSNNIDSFGSKGLIQPGYTYLARIIYSFDFGGKK